MMIQLPRHFSFLGFISNYKIAGVLPLDWTLHFIIGAVVTVVCLKRGMSFFRTACIIIGMALGKEFYDYFFHLPKDHMEFVSDFFITVLYLGVLFCVRKFKNASSSTPRESDRESKSSQHIDIYD